MGWRGAALQPARGATAWPGALGCKRERGPASPAFSHPHYQITFLTPKGG